MLEFFRLGRIIGFTSSLVMLALAKRSLRQSGMTLSRDVSNTDLAVLYLYTHQDLSVYHYKSINDVLRGKSHARSREILEIAAMLASALGKMPVHKGYCVRYVSLSASELLDYIVGNTVTFEAFSSSSANMSLFWPLNVRFTIISNSGRDISSVSRYPKEKEVLFAPKSRFKVLQSSTSSGISDIVLREV